MKTIQSCKSLARYILILEDDVLEGCTTFRRMTFRRYDVASNATFGCCNVLSSVTFGREKLSGTTFSRKCQPSFLIQRHLRS